MLKLPIRLIIQLLFCDRQGLVKAAQLRASGQRQLAASRTQLTQLQSHIARWSHTS